MRCILARSTKAWAALQCLDNALADCLCLYEVPDEADYADASGGAHTHSLEDLQRPIAATIIDKEEFNAVT